MTKQRTIYHLIVDKSGSMSNCIENTITGFNEQLTKIMQMEKEFPEQDITIGLTTFSHEVYHHFFQARACMVPKLTGNTYRPNGNTALLDAIGSTVQYLENEGFANTREIPTTFVVVILTDGFENSSRKFTLEDIRTTITRLEATGNWTFSFIGATLDAVDIAERMSIKRQNSFIFSKDQMKEEVWDKLSDSMHGYFDKKRSGKDLGNLFDK